MVELIPWGRSPDGEAGFLAILNDGHGLEVKVASYGATLVSIRTPDRTGRIEDVLLGFETWEGYAAADIHARWPYFGSTIGRYANRIAGARFAIDGQEYRLTANEAQNQNHGGRRGFDRASWRMSRLHGVEGVSLSYRSPDGEEGFPGTLDVVAEITLPRPGQIEITYRAATDRPTHVNLTSHGYFNLAGRGARSIADHQLSIAATSVLPIDLAAIPTGELRPVAGTSFDLRRPALIGETLAANDPQLVIGDGLNHCFVLDRGAAVDARLHHPASGRVMELTTTAPGLQVYSSNAFDGSLFDDEGRPFVRHQAVALEAQYFPDSPNRPHFPSTLLRPGETHETTTKLRFFSE